ncbi:MAG: Ig-like domain-containing protein [bacterium]|nr:Ig-like domain-containing protein [bacterium]
MKPSKRFGVFVVVVVFIVSCGTDREQATTTSSDKDTTAPSVASVSAGGLVSSQASTGAKLSISQSSSWTIEFDEAMDESTIVGTTDYSCKGTVQISSDNFSSCVPVAGISADANKKVFTIALASTLAYDTTYYIKVTQAAKDLAGNLLEAEYIVPNGFTTEPSPRTDSPNTTLALGLGHSCAAFADGSAKCWGFNISGQLGDGTTTNRLLPVSVSGISTAIGLSSYETSTCVLLTSGAVKCFGSNNTGQLGTGTYDNSSTPVSVYNISTASQVAAGSWHSCALLADQTIQCWGQGVLGQLGDGTSSSTATLLLTTVTGISTATQLASGSYHSCALLSDQTVKCWGSNGYGQLGDGATGYVSSTKQTTPVNVIGISNATSLALGGAHSCALLADKSIQCWGSNSSGQLGDGTTTESSTPKSVNGISTATVVALGSSHSCALLASKQVQCWGRNDYGQLGDTTTTDRSAPVTVTGISDVIGIAAGYNHSCAVLSNGGVSCWGANYYGQLGNGSTTNSSVPVQVSF